MLPPLPRKKKAQLSFEQIGLLTVLFVSLLFVASFTLSQTQDYLKYSRASDTITRLGDAADTLNQLGPQNKETVYVDIPHGLTGAVVKGNVLSVELVNKKSYTDVTKKTVPNLIGGFAVHQGQRGIAVKSINETLVRIGEGLILFSITPNCVTTSQMPVTITLFGDEITNNTEVRVVHGGFNYGVPILSQTPTHITFSATAGFFPPSPQGNPYLIHLKEGTTLSNSLKFYSYPSSNLCGAPNALQLAHLYAGQTHQFIEDITQIVLVDDGNKKRVATEEVVHLAFASTLKKDDFVRLVAFCHDDGVLSLLRDSTSTSVGSITCSAGSWETYEVYITQNPPQDTWDLSSTVDVAYDFIGGYNA